MSVRSVKFWCSQHFRICRGPVVTYFHCGQLPVNLTGQLTEVAGQSEICGSERNVHYRGADKSIARPD